MFVFLLLPVLPSTCLQSTVFYLVCLRSTTAIAGSYNSGSSERDKSGDSRSSDLNLVYFVRTLESWKELCGTATLVNFNFVVNQLG